jgi:curved DNA-binding protein CbpA
MNTVPRAQSARAKRRSTRVAEAVFLTWRGIDGDGQPFVERTGTLELSFHGCKYFTKHAVTTNLLITLELSDQQASAPPRRVQARVAWERKSRNIPGLFQVGVEIDPPGNVWGVVSPPKDWQQPKPRTESDAAVLEREMKELLTVATKGTYYQLLRVTSDSPNSIVKRNYYELVRRFHPDRHLGQAELTQSLHSLLSVFTVAYKTLIDEKAREEYDQRLVASGTFVLSRHETESGKAGAGYLQQARECFQAGNYGGSIRWLRKALEIQPNSSQNHALLARSLSAVPSYRTEAIEHFQKAIEINPLNAAVHFQLGALYQEMKLLSRARLHYQKVLELDPENSNARERLRLLDAVERNKGTGEHSIS